MNNQNRQSRRLFFLTTAHQWLLILLLIIFIVYSFIKPLVLSIDSVYGFLAYKGTLFFHSFNVLQEIPLKNISEINPVFVSWWAPGQWIFPVLLNYFFGVRFGVASIVITALSLISGFAGYYRVFGFFRFSRIVSIMSLLVIFSSSTLYYGFIVYQGGEMLEFAIFPWFVQYVFKIRRISPWNLLAVGGLVLLCFIAKTTLLIYCPLVLIARVVSFYRDTANGKLLPNKKNLLLFLPLFISGLVIYLFYLSRGPRPTLMNHFQLSAGAILVSLTAPLSSIASIQQWIDRATNLLSGIFHAGVGPVLISSVLYVFVFLMFVLISRNTVKDKTTGAPYKNLLLILYTGLFLFFLWIYSFQTNIDLNARHFKLAGFLFVPVILSFLYHRFKPPFVHALILIVCLIAVADILYLKSKWTNGRYVGVNYFYNNCSQLGVVDKLDEDSYNKLVKLERVIGNKEASLIVFAESTADIAMDLKHPVIFMAPGENITGKIYHGNDPMLLVAISKTTISTMPGFLQTKFPDYKHFELSAETGRYLFFVSAPGHDTKKYLKSYFTL